MVAPPEFYESVLDNARVGFARKCVRCGGQVTICGTARERFDRMVAGVLSHEYAYGTCDECFAAAIVLSAATRATGSGP